MPGNKRFWKILHIPKADNTADNCTVKFLKGTMVVHALPFKKHTVKERATTTLMDNGKITARTFEI